MESGDFLGILFFHSQESEINLLGIWTSRNVGIRELKGTGKEPISWQGFGTVQP